MIFGTLPGGAPVELFELSSDKLTVRISNYGGRIISVVKDGMDMIVGPKHFEDMLKDTCYCGAICGRVANRIAKGRFSIDGDSHSVAVNNGPNHLHGGVQGFDSKIWQVQEATRNTLVLTLHSADGEENYPGNLEVVATYTVVEETLHLRLEAYADAATIVNLTNHAYWNLSGKPTIDSMTLEVRASAYTPVDATNIPDGRILPVEGTDFDLEVEAAEGGIEQESVLIVTITTINYGTITATLILETQNSVHINIECSAEFPKDELLLRLQSEQKHYSMESVISFETKKSTPQQPKTESTIAKINMSHTNEISPYLLLAAHSLIRHTIELDRT